MTDLSKVKATFADLERITGLTFRTVRERLKDVAPVCFNGKSDFYLLADAIPALYRANRNEKELVTIEEIRARTRNWHLTADRSEIKKDLESGKLYQVDEVHRTLDRMLLSFKTRLESIPSRIAAIDGDDYFLRMEQAEKIVDEALMEINHDAIRMSQAEDAGADNQAGEADPTPFRQ
ncbi:MAG: hypothetical protein H6618_09510 [Deltaproteobacteria bacterium]|nr:hypothetical protein [Deltaproteobacteria bacterium]